MNLDCALEHLERYGKFTGKDSEQLTNLRKNIKKGKSVGKVNEIIRIGEYVKRMEDMEKELKHFVTMEKDCNDALDEKDDELDKLRKEVEALEIARQQEQDKAYRKYRDLDERHTHLKRIVSSRVTQAQWTSINLAFDDRFGNLSMNVCARVKIKRYEDLPIFTHAQVKESKPQTNLPVVVHDDDVDPYA